MRRMLNIKQRVCWRVAHNGHRYRDKVIAALLILSMWWDERVSGDGVKMSEIKN
jgi:hypothetical protein